MKDKIFGLYDKCPACGQSKGLYYQMQYPLIVSETLNGKPFCYKKGKRTTKLSNRHKAGVYNVTLSSGDYQVAICNCSLCGWVSEPITQ